MCTMMHAFRSDKPFVINILCIELKTVECIDVGLCTYWDLGSGEDAAGVTAVSRTEVR